jgi:thiol:disulfide interchange protein DsbD
MPRNVCLLLALIGLAVPGTSSAYAQGSKLGWEEAVKTPIAARFEPATAKRGQTVTVQIVLDLAPEYYGYSLKQTDPDSIDSAPRLSFKSVPDGLTRVGDWGEQATTKKTLDGSKILEGKVIYEQQFQVSPEVAPGEKEIQVDARIQVCKHIGKTGTCLPNRQFTLPAKLTVTNEQIAAPPPPEGPKAELVAPNHPAAPPAPAKPAEPAPGVVTFAPESAAEHESAVRWVMSQLETQKATPRGSLAFILAGIFWGAVSLVTPCVFPMIPITVSFFLKQSDKKHHRPVTMALVYCGTIVFVLTIAAVLLLSVFRYLSTNPYMNIGMGVLFIVFALSLFGMYDLELPSGLARFTSSREGKGGLVGTMFMALTFTIVSFACVAPFLGGFGGTAASSQITLLDRILGGFAFAVTFASPFFILALFPALLKKLPRSGTWLNSVKVVMGFLELAAALVFFRTSELVLLPTPVLFTYDLVLGLWLAIALLCGLYLLNVFRLPHDMPLEHLGVLRMLFGLLFIGLGLYLLPALFKSGADGDKQRPNGVIYAWVESFLLPESTGRKGTGLPWSANLKKAVEEARTRSKATRQRTLLLIDFTGESCKNCRYNEHNVFTKPEIADLMRKYELVQLYTDKVPPEFYPPDVRDRIGNDVSRLRDDARVNLDFQKQAFDTEQLPLYVILDPVPQGDDQKIDVVGIYSEGKINDTAAFTQFLKEPLNSPGQRAQVGY